MKLPLRCALLLLAACTHEAGVAVPEFAHRIPGGAILVVQEPESGMLGSLGARFDLPTAHEGGLSYLVAPDLDVGWPTLADSTSFAHAWSRLTPTSNEDWLYLDCALAIDALRARLRATGARGLIALRAIEACGLGDLGPLLLTRQEQQYRGWLGAGTSRFASLFRGRQAANGLSAGDSLLELSASMSPDALLAIVDALLEGTSGGGPFSMLLQAMPLRILSDVRELLVACDGRVWLRIQDRAIACEIGLRDREAFEDLLDRIPVEVGSQLRRMSQWRGNGAWLRLSDGESPPERPAAAAPAGAFCLLRGQVGMFPGIEVRDPRMVEVRWSSAAPDGFVVHATLP